MIHRNTSAIEAVNNGTPTPDAFYHKSTLIATSKWHATDAWRGYNELTAEPGWLLLDSDWTTGDYDDAIAAEHGTTPTEARLAKLEAEHRELWVIYTPTSNVFSTGIDVLVRDPNWVPLSVDRGKTVGHKTRRFELPNNGWRIRYHATDVITYDGADTYTLNSGGWQTKTTKERINQYLPTGFWISQKNFVWTVHTPTGPLEFTDGMTVEDK